MDKNTLALAIASCFAPLNFRISMQFVNVIVARGNLRHVSDRFQFVEVMETIAKHDFYQRNERSFFLFFAFLQRDIPLKK